MKIHFSPLHLGKVQKHIPRTILCYRINWSHKTLVLFSTSFLISTENSLYMTPFLGCILKLLYLRIVYTVFRACLPIFIALAPFSRDCKLLCRHSYFWMPKSLYLGGNVFIQIAPINISRTILFNHLTLCTDSYINPSALWNMMCRLT